MGDIQADLLDVWYRRSEQVSPVRIRTLTRKRLMEHLGEFGLVRGAEVGVARGHFSEYMLKYIAGSQILSVDPWHWAARGESFYCSTARRLAPYNDGPLMVLMTCRECGRVFEFAAALTFKELVKCPACDPRRWQEAEPPPFLHPTRAGLGRRLTTGRTAGERALVMRMSSLEAVRHVPDASLDFVYIDGDHRFDQVMTDLILWAQKVRYGGVVSGHDYYRFRKAGVVPAVDLYTRQHGVGRWFLTDERTPSFFWVRARTVADDPGEEVIDGIV